MLKLEFGCLLQGDPWHLYLSGGYLTCQLALRGTEEIPALTPDVYAYEPHLALFSGPGALTLLERFCREAKQSVSSSLLPVMLLRLVYQQRESLTRLLLELWPQSTVTSIQDYAGWDRCCK